MMTITIYLDLPLQQRFSTLFQNRGIDVVQKINIQCSSSGCLFTKHIDVAIFDLTQHPPSSLPGTYILLDFRHPKTSLRTTAQNPNFANAKAIVRCDTLSNLEVVDRIVDILVD
jgi:hypothetical protein